MKRRKEEEGEGLDEMRIKEGKRSDEERKATRKDERSEWRGHEEMTRGAGKDRDQERTEKHVAVPSRRDFARA